MSHSKIPDGIFMFPTTSEGLPSSPLGKKRELDEEAVEAVDTIPPPPSPVDLVKGEFLPWGHRWKEEGETFRRHKKRHTSKMATCQDIRSGVRSHKRGCCADADGGNEVINILSLLRVILIHYDCYDAFSLVVTSKICSIKIIAFMPMKATTTSRP